MRKSRFIETQIVGLIKEAEAGRKVACKLPFKPFISKASRLIETQLKEFRK